MLQVLQAVACGPPIATAETLIRNDKEQVQVMKDPSHVVRLEMADLTGVRKIPRALFLRSDLAGYSSLVDQLQRNRWCCYIASFREGLALLRQQHFQIVFSDVKIPESTMTYLVSQLIHSRSCLFFHLDVEDGCWWLPAIVAGQDCRGTPALSPKDFNRLLIRILRETHGESRGDRS